MAVEAGQSGTGTVKTELRENAVGLPGILMQGIATIGPSFAILASEETCNGDSKQADENSQQDYPAGRCSSDLTHKDATEDWRHECAECRAQPQHHSHPER